MDDNKTFQDIISRSTVAVITDKNGNKTKLTPVQAAQAGISDRIPATGTKPIFKTSEGWSFDVADAPASIDINPETGNIRITAPKEITDSDMFKQVFDEEQLKQYSQAYKLNPEYKISVTEKNEETGTEEEKEITIPEYVERLNSSISNYMQDLRTAHNYREKLISKYGKKANNLTDEQLIKAGQEQAKALYLPDTILNVGNFGKGTNPFLQLAGLRTEDGLVSTEEFSKVYNRENFGRDEIAAVLAAIDGTLRGSGWDKEGTYTDEEGNVYDNRNSAEEAAKLIAFRNYIVSNNPTSDNWQQMGDYIESFVDNAAYQTTKIFENLANIGEAVVTGGEGQFFQNNIEEMDEAMEYFNENNAVVWDAVTNAQIWGTLGGMALGTWGAGELLALPFKGLSAASGALTTKYMATAARVAELADNGVKISTGAQLAFKAMTIAEKVNLGINMAMTGISGLVHRNFFTEYVFDTMHDALLYDSTGFRDMLSSMSRAAEADQKAGIALEYWIGQYADNAKWWAPMGAARALVKTAGKTTLGKAANIVLTKYINKVEAKIGTKIQGVQDNLGGGTVIAKLEEKLQKAEDAGATTKANRIKRQIQQENFNIQLRAAREQIGNVKLDWDGVRLTEESAQEWKNAMTRLKAVENGIDLYNGGVDAQTRAMLNAIIDPATGKPGFLYEELAGANIKASQWYFKLVDLNKKYGLGIAPKSLINQEVIDYWQGSFKQRIYQAFADSGTENGAKAAAALPTVEENLASLRAILPEEITKFIDEGLDQKVYQGFYKQLNKFGMDEKLLVRSTVEGYENNPIWVENGYMPISLDVDPGGRWISEDDKIETVIEQEMDKLVFGATAGEHFRDPELVRQVRIRHMAQAKVNDEIWKSYSGWGSNATNVTVISGEETEFAKQVQAGQKAMQTAISQQASGAFSENLIANIVKTKRRRPVENAQVDAATKETIVSSMSRSDTSWYLSQGKYSPLKTPQSKLTDGVTAKNYDEWYDGQSEAVKKYLAQQAGDSPQPSFFSQLEYDGNATFHKTKPSYAKFSEMVQKGGDDFETGLQRAYLMGNKAFGKSSLLNEATKNVKAGKDAFYEGVLAAKMKGELKGVLNVDTDQFVDDMLTSIRGMVDDYVAGTAGAPGAAEAVKALAETTDGANAAARYSVLQELLKKENLDKAKKALFDQVEELRKGKNLNSDWVDLLHKKTEEMLVDVIKTERDSARAAARTFNAELTDSQTLFDEVSDINKRIIEAEKRVGTDYVMYLDDEGRKVYAQVDPAFASLFNYRYKMEKAEANVVARINGLMSKAFRYGTTSVNLSSFGNQLFRDFGNALFVGGAWQTIKTSADDLVTVFGQRIVDQIKQFEPEEYKRTEAMAEQTGRTLEQTAVSRELMRGAAMAPSSTERTLYKTFMKKAYGQDVDTVLKKAQNKFQEFVDKHNPDDLLNGKRENYLRNRVFAANLDDAMKQGYTLQQARVFADFAMNNATTNFGRQLYHLQAIADSTPYFRAAINGTKSFWRMWALDPVGITGRIMGGLILPTMYLTGMSLGDEESRAIYMNIQEHQKQNSMVFVFNGQAVSVPIPQELGAIVSPFRQFVEYLYDSNKNDFWELMMNDLLGLSPINLQGFSTIDMDQMVSDPTIFDRLSRGFARVFSEIAPIPVKTAYMLATGTDPYTGRSLQDTSYVTYNEETGSLEVMDYNENAFAKLFASWFGDSISPELAEELISGLIGSTGSNILGDLTRLVQESPEAALQSAGKNITEQIKKPFDVNEYDYTTAVWKRAIRQLTTEKKAILDSKEMQAYNSALAQTKDPDERKKILAQRQTLVDGFEQKVKDTVERLSSAYGGTLDRQKLAAVINLLNFNSDPGYQSGSQYSSNVASESFWNGRDAAVHTLERMGVSGAGDTSIFGYLTVDKDGNPIVKYTSPIAIMDMENQWKNQDDIHTANIKALVSENNIYDAHEAVKKQIDAIYGSKSKLTNQDYANIDAIKINWNAELAKTIAPYVSQMTPEAAINNNDVMNALYPYVEVPNSWEVNNKGKSVSLGDRGNKKKAYYDSWIKSLFSVNDPYKGQY